MFRLNSKAASVPMDDRITETSENGVKVGNVGWTKVVGSTVAVSLGVIGSSTDVSPRVVDSAVVVE